MCSGTRSDIPVSLSREGYVFKGWSFDRLKRDASGNIVQVDGANTTETERFGPTTNQSEIATAFERQGDVILTANWEETAVEATHFFTDDRPLDASGGADQTHVIKVKLSDSPRKLKSIEFADNDKSGLVKDKTTPIIWVSGSETAPAGNWWTNVGGTINREMDLVDLGDGSYGVYVGISVYDGVIDESQVVGSYAGGSYIASLVTMNYTFA